MSITGQTNNMSEYKTEQTNITYEYVTGQTHMLLAAAFKAVTKKKHWALTGSVCTHCESVNTHWIATNSDNKEQKRTWYLKMIRWCAKPLFLCKYKSLIITLNKNRKFSLISHLSNVKENRGLIISVTLSCFHLLSLCLSLIHIFSLTPHPPTISHPSLTSLFFHLPLPSLPISLTPSCLYNFKYVSKESNSPGYITLLCHLLYIQHIMHPQAVVVLAQVAQHSFRSTQFVRTRQCVLAYQRNFDVAVWHWPEHNII